MLQKQGWGFPFKKSVFKTVKNPQILNQQFDRMKIEKKLALQEKWEIDRPLLMQANELTIKIFDITGSKHIITLNLKHISISRSTLFAT